MFNIRLFIIMVIILTTLDLIFIGLITNKLWYKNVSNIQKSPLSVKPFYGLLSYIFIWIVLYYFILKDMNKTNYKNKLFEAFLLGFSCYAIFDFTNLAIFKDYDLLTAMIDMIWGGSVFLLTTYLIMKINF
jgi:uncharacterized membrane protein